MTILLVRHAVAKARHNWDGDDESRPLTGRGREQAALLVGRLRSYEIERVLSSPSVRCVDTVTPLAAARGLKAARSKALAEGSDRDAIALVRRLLNDDVDAALCSHGDVIPTVLDALEVDWHACAKGSTWVLRPRGKARYIPPPA